jgi:hypothetical protein
MNYKHLMEDGLTHTSDSKSVVDNDNGVFFSRQGAQGIQTKSLASEALASEEAGDGNNSPTDMKSVELDDIIVDPITHNVNAMQTAPETAAQALDPINSQFDALMNTRDNNVNLVL